MSDPREKIEYLRRRARLSQVQLAKIFEVTQGHYSKVISGRVRLSGDLQNRMETWLQSQSQPVGEGQIAWRMQALAASIRRECMELMQLAEQAGGGTD